MRKVKSVVMKTSPWVGTRQNICLNFILHALYNTLTIHNPRFNTVIMSNLFETLLGACGARVEIDDRLTAKRIAIDEYVSPERLNRFVVWTDASHTSDANGIAIVWRKNPAINIWSHLVFKLDPIFCNNTAEFFAISEAVKLAVQRLQGGVRVSKLIIYTDSQSALLWIRDYHTKIPNQRCKFPRQFELAKLKENVNKLSNTGAEVIFRWVPGHSAVSGNVRADRLAARAARSSTGSSHFPRLQYPVNGYVEPPSREELGYIVENRDIEEFEVVRQAPVRQLYTARIVRAIEVEIVSQWLDKIEAAIEAQLEME